mgnify:CR=1 FL=1
MDDKPLLYLLEDLDTYVELYRKKYLSCAIDSSEESEIEAMWNLLIRASNTIRIIINKR